MAIAVQMDYTVDLCKPVQLIQMEVPFFTGDKNAHRFHVTLARNGCPISMSGISATGYMVRADKQTVVWNGEVTDDGIYLTMPASCYVKSGRFRILLRVHYEDTIETALWVEGAMREGTTDTVVDPGSEIPNLEELLAQIAAMEQLTDESRAATEDAIAAAQETRAATAEILTSAAIPVVCTESGSTITMQDASDGRALTELSIMGKTTQDGTPTPTAPIDIVSVENTTVYITGANLCNMPEKTYTVSGITMVSEGGAIAVSGTATETVSTNSVISHAIVGLPAGKYTISGSNSNVMVNCFVRNADGTRTFYHDATFEVDGTQQNLTVYLGMSAGVSANTTVYPMLVYGETAKPWEKYSGSQSVALAHTLRGIPVTSGGNYTDETGQQWVCDEVDLARGKLVQRVCVVDAVSLPWKYSTVNSLFYADTPVGSAAAMCSAYPFIGAYSDWLLPDTDQSLSLYATLAGMRIKDSRYTTVSQFTQALTGNQIAYPLAAPIETDLTADEIAAFQQLRSVYGNTTVYNDAGAGMRVGYVADTKLYIDRKIAAIATALVNA